VFRWSTFPVLDGPAAAALGVDLPFGTREDADDWLAAMWSDLAGAGVESVSLHEDGSVVFGPMSLTPVE